MSDTIIVYHDNCHDGVTAAAIAQQALTNAGIDEHMKQRPTTEAFDPIHYQPELYPARYGNPPDLDRLRGKVVYILDFSWKRPDMDAIAEVALFVFVYDHHASAERELENFDDHDNVKVVFDMNRSGAGITWDELVGGPRPAHVDFVEERDLWRHKLPDTPEQHRLTIERFHVATNSHPLDVPTRHKLMATDPVKLVMEGEAILRYHHKLVASVCEGARGIMFFRPYHALLVECPAPELISDVCHKLLEDHPGAEVAATYMQRDGDVVFSLRSREDGPDVSVIAERFGGGGHPHSAGFVMTGAEITISKEEN